MRLGIHDHIIQLHEELVHLKELCPYRLLRLHTQLRCELKTHFSIHLVKRQKEWTRQEEQIYLEEQRDEGGKKTEKKRIRQ